MTSVALVLRDLLWPALLGALAILAVLLAGLVAQRLVERVIARRRGRENDRIRPLVHAYVRSGDDQALAGLRAAGGRGRRAIATVLLEPLHLVTGREVDRARVLALELDLTAWWTRRAGHRDWRTRLEAIRALGLLREPAAAAVLLAALEDDDEAVRSAAVDALGLIADPGTLPELVHSLSRPGWLPRVRVVEALRQFGSAAASALIARGESEPEDRAAIAALLGSLRASQAHDTLLGWAGDPHPTTRAASWRALAEMGPGERAYYHALKGLRDPVPEVRSAAATALGRTGREDAVGHLAPALDDEWEVAARSARALQVLGPAGLEALRARAAGPEGSGQALAAHVLWEAAP